MISVIIPVYNGEKYIGELIDNLRQQTVSGADRFELVFVDDGSCDNSLQVLRELSDCSEFTVSVYSQKNAGVSAARNRGMEMAKGEYVTFVDVDDFVTANYFETLEINAKHESFDVLVFDSTRVHSADDVHMGAGEVAPGKEISGMDMLSLMLSNPTKFGVVNLLLKKTFVQKNALHFSVGYKYYEDYDFIYRAFGKAGKICKLDAPLYFYVLRENSAMQRFTVDRVKCLTLMRELVPWFHIEVPAFYRAFEAWGISRIVWSILWQACLAFDQYEAFEIFSQKIEAHKYFAKLRHFPDRRVRLSVRVYMISPRLFYTGVRKLGASRQKIEKADIESFEEVF